MAVLLRSACSSSGAEHEPPSDQPRLVGVEDLALGVPDLDAGHAGREHAGAHDVVEPGDRPRIAAHDVGGERRLDDAVAGHRRHLLGLAQRLRRGQAAQRQGAGDADQHQHRQAGQREHRHRPQDPAAAHIASTCVCMAPRMPVARDRRHGPRTNVRLRPRPAGGQSALRSHQPTEDSMRRTSLISALIGCFVVMAVIAPMAAARDGSGVTRTIALHGSVSFPGATGHATSKISSERARARGRGAAHAGPGRQARERVRERHQAGRARACPAWVRSTSSAARSAGSACRASRTARPCASARWAAP